MVHTVGRRARSFAGGIAFAMTVAAAVGVAPAGVAEASHTLDLVSVVPARLLETRIGPSEQTVDHEFEGIGKRSAGAVEISAGQNFTCARIENGTVQCWGAKATLLGNGDPSGSQSTPIAVAGLTGVASIDAGTFYTCATLTNGGAKCWGFGSSGQLGTGSIADRPTPTSMTGYEGSIVAVDAADGTSGHSTCAVLDDMTAVCWGYNFNKELGALTPGADSRATSLTPLLVGS